MSRPLRVLLGVSGGIAAYKSAELVRRLRSRGHEVRCALTRSAASFVAPLTLEVLSGQPRLPGGVPGAAGRLGRGGAHHRRRLGRGAVRGPGHHPHPRPAGPGARRRLPDHHRARLRRPGGGRARHALRDVGEAEPTRQHVETLKRRGVWFAGPVEGPLASGEVGMGRMAEPEEIARAVEAAAGAGPLAGRTVLVTAGPTFEPVDPVRFLGNRSSGKMGFALAAEAARRGARTILVAGPVALPTPPGVTRVDVITAREMERGRPRARAGGRPDRHGGGGGRLPAEPAGGPQDQEGAGAAGRSSWRRTRTSWPACAPLAPGAVLVGFAAETHDLERNARAKLERKGADFLVANDVSALGHRLRQRRQRGHRLPPGGGAGLPRRGGPKGELAASLFDLFAATLPP